MATLTVPPDPYTDAQRASAMPDDYQHDVVGPIRTGQGPGPRCGQLVVAPDTSVYGIRPCLSVLVEVSPDVWRHYNYPRTAAGGYDWSHREVER